MKRHYPNAPITEAIIDLRVHPSIPDLPSRIKSLSSRITSDYPETEEIFEAVGQMEFRPGATASATANQRWIGMKGFGFDRRQIYQFLTAGFTFSRLAPYDSWKAFADSARELWSLYRESLPPEKVIRLAVRYINRIDIPGDTIDLKEYFRTSPEVSPDLPQTLEGFFMQLRIPIAGLPGLTLVNQTIIPPEKEGFVSVVLDIDLFLKENIPQSEPEIWDSFERLHTKKNEVFEACITNSARKLFE